MEGSPLMIDLPEALVGPRVLLRPYRLEDGPAMWEAVAESREHLRPWMPWADRYETALETRPFIVRSQANWLMRDDLLTAMFDRETGRFLGSAGLHRIDWAIRKFEIGYWIRKSAEGQGYVSESVRLLTRFAFDSLSACRVEIRMDTRNHRSKAVPQRLGFTLEGVLRNAHIPQAGETKPSDTYVWSLIPEEYRALPWSKTEA